MNIYPILSSTSFIFANKISLALTPLQKKVAVVVAVAFCLLAVAYLIGKTFCNSNKYLFGSTPSLDDSVRDVLQEPQDIDKMNEEVVFFREKEKTKYTDPCLQKYEVLTPALITELARQQNHGFYNTGLTELLAVHYAFDAKVQDDREDIEVFKELNVFLQELVDQATVHGNEEGMQVLTYPNASSQPNPIVRNTPLCLMVKAGNLEGVEILLPLYKLEDLLQTTPRGNTVLHLAFFTGQLAIAQAIMKRAEELGCLESLVTMRNIKDNAPGTLFKTVASFDSKNSFKDYLDIANDLLGGEEINKARCSKGKFSQQMFLHRQFVLKQLAAVLPSWDIQRVIKTKELPSLLAFIRPLA